MRRLGMPVSGAILAETQAAMNHAVGGMTAFCSYRPNGVSSFQVAMFAYLSTAPRASNGRLRSKADLPISLLVPAMPEQSQNDDEAVEELDVEAAQARRDNPALNE